MQAKFFLLLQNVRCPLPHGLILVGHLDHRLDVVWVAVILYYFGGVGNVVLALVATAAFSEGESDLVLEQEDEGLVVAGC